jgi:hypothetical protein
MPACNSAAEFSNILTMYNKAYSGCIYIYIYIYILNVMFTHSLRPACSHAAGLNDIIMTYYIKGIFRQHNAPHFVHSFGMSICSRCKV